MKRPRSAARELPLAARRKVSTRARALASWRGIDLAEEEGARARPAKSVADILPTVIDHVGFERKRAELEIVKAWNHLMDPLVAQHAQPSNLFKGTLFVTVDSNVWLDEIVRNRRRDILKRLKNCFGPTLIQRISFRCG